MHSTELKIFIKTNERNHYVYGDARTLIYDTEDNSMKFIQNAALFILALNCGIIAYWFGQHKPIFDDFLTNHGAKNEKGDRNGHPRNQFRIFGWQIPGFGKFIGMNRFMILVSFLLKIIIPFVDSITGKLNRHSFYDTLQFNLFRWKLLFISSQCID